MGEVFKNVATTQLDGSIDDTTTTVVVDSAMGFTGGDFRILIDSEIMKVTGVSGLSFTVVRHQEGTTAVPHSNDAPVYHVLTSGAVDAHEQNDLVVRDAYASRPAAGAAGRLFLPTDGMFIERDNGATWDKFGPIWPLTPPLAANFPTWLNQGTSTCIDNKGAMYLTVQYYSSLTIRGVVKAYPTPPFTIETAFLPCVGQGMNTRLGMGLVIRDSVAGTMQAYGAAFMSNYRCGLGGENYSNYTTYNSAVTGWTGTYGVNEMQDASLVWIKYQDDTSHRIISFSADGYTWMQMVSLSTTDYVTPNQIGYFIDGYMGAANLYLDPSLVVYHWKQY